MQLLIRTWIHLLKILSFEHLRVRHLRCIYVASGIYVAPKLVLVSASALAACVLFDDRSSFMCMKRFLIFEIHNT